MPQTDLARETLLAYAAVCDTRATGTYRGLPPQGRWDTAMPLVGASQIQNIKPDSSRGKLPFGGGPQTDFAGVLLTIYYPL